MPEKYEGEGEQKKECSREPEPGKFSFRLLAAKLAFDELAVIERVVRYSQFIVTRSLGPACFFIRAALRAGACAGWHVRSADRANIRSVDHSLLACSFRARAAAVSNANAPELLVSLRLSRAGEEGLSLRGLELKSLPAPEP